MTLQPVRCNTISQSDDPLGLQERRRIVRRCAAVIVASMCLRRAPASVPPGRALLTRPCVKTRRPNSGERAHERFREADDAANDENPASRRGDSSGRRHEVPYRRRHVSCLAEFP